MLLDFYLLDVSYEIVSQEPHIIIWGISRDGKRILLRDRRFRPYFYAILRQASQPDAVARRITALSEAASPLIRVEPVEKKYFGKPVTALKIVTVIPEHVRRYREKVKQVPEVLEVVEADIRFSLRYVLDHHLRPCGWHRAEVEARVKNPQYRVEEEYEVVGEITPLDDWSTPRLRILAFDIEVYNETGSPKPERDPVIIIGVLTSEGLFKQFLAEGMSDKHAIMEFAKFIQSYDPDIIVGYNSNRFDWQYLLERARVLGVRLDVGRKKDSPPSTSTYGHVSITGRLNVDLYDYAEEIPEIKIKSLDIVADYLGVMKRESRVLIDYMEFPKYWNDPSKRSILLKYNEDDVRSTMGLSEKFLPFAMQLSNITRLPLDQVGAASVGNRLEWFLMHEALQSNELTPNREEKEAETYKGAVVLSPLKGIHEDIVVLDFTSMYPNIMIKYNVGPDTIEKTTSCSPNNHNIAPEVGHCFRREPSGFFKNVLSMLLDVRRQLREELKKYPPESLEYRVLDERQRAVKILANAAYGYMGWLGARWYCRECAEAVTAWGRSMITRVITKAREIGLKVVYGDTDSLFVENNPSRVKELMEYVEKELGFDIKIDKIYERVFFTEAKKRYAGLLKDGRVDIVGFEAVRGDWTELAKEVQENITSILLREKNVDKAVEYVKTVISSLMQSKIPIEKLVIWKTLTKRIEEYDVESPHVAAARKLERKGLRVDVGDKIGFVVVKGPGKISERAEPFNFVKDPRLLDVNYYIEHQVIPAALRVLEYFGVTENDLKRVASTAGKRSLFDYLGKQ